MFNPKKKIRKLPPNPRKPHEDWNPTISRVVPFDLGTVNRPREKERRICDSKHHYDSLEKAIFDAKIYKHHVYECWICGSWHLTSPK